ncbi:Nuclear Hormone Receptor family [Aphelenchoides bicaudatus]|nr:Nuclear Hormone Receptor family [Aphelenchoides bicaudatus]
MCWQLMETNLSIKHCLICDDSVGLISKHYGGLCCSGCRGFFRRTVRFNRHYVCAKDGLCDTRKNLRNVCRSCRYERCLKAGLNPMLVHSDRACDRNLNKRLQKIQEIEMPASSPENNLNETTISVYDAINLNMHAQKAKNLAIIEGRKMFKADNLPLGYKGILEHLKTRDFNSVQQFFILTEKLCNEFFDNANNHLLATKCSYTYNLNASVEEAFLVEPRCVSDRTKIDWTPRFFLNGNDFKKVWCRVSVYYIDWISHIPELNLLDEADKLNLIIGRCIPCVWSTFAHRAYLCKTKNCFPLSGGSYYPMDAEQILFKDPVLSKFLHEMCSWVWDECVEPAREYEFTESEFALLKVLCFVTVVPNLSAKGKQIVNDASTFYQEALSNLILANSNCQTFESYTKRLSTLLSILPALEKTTQIEDAHLMYMTLFDVCGLQGDLTYNFYVRRTMRT